MKPTATPPFAVIDSHHHFWKYAEGEYGWIDDSMAVLRRDFLPQHLAAELSAANVEGVVSVQARQSLEETAWLLGFARSHAFIRGVVGWAPLADPRLPEILAPVAADQKLVGVRHVVQGEPDDDFILREDFNAGIRTLRAFGLRYDILILARHLPQTIRFVDRHPNQVFVLDHIAKPRIREGVISPWRENILELARRPNVYCKLSGLVTEADPELEARRSRSLHRHRAGGLRPRRLMFGWTGLSACWASAIPVGLPSFLSLCRSFRCRTAANLLRHGGGSLWSCVCLIELGRIPMNGMIPGGPAWGGHSIRRFPSEGERTKWYREAKFGMFIHWGPYSLASVEASWPIMLPESGASARPSIARCRRRFNPVKFDPDAWVRLAKAAGQRYMVFTSKHHDGFCMFDSPSPTTRSPTRPTGRTSRPCWPKPAKKEGMPLGFYYSPPDMDHPGFRDTSKLSPPTGTASPRGPSGRSTSNYMELQLTELLTRYGDVAVIWFDGLSTSSRNTTAGGSTN